MGYRSLLAWAQRFGTTVAFGIEGTGSYGAGLTRFLRDAGCTVIEVNRPNRQTRRRQGKSDPIDAEAAARAVMSGEARCIAKDDQDRVGMIRTLSLDPPIDDVLRTRWAVLPGMAMDFWLQASVPRSTRQ